ncbi:MAG: TonB-dependent receptor [Scytonema sp. PMC 1069.18]|nr:TonB-dependent receptor [Scytonema sp. PMC 1069.18]MEC4880341.1 TonB-dependent receptor [Scytonema sp. PMC 1070.18]
MKLGQLVPSLLLTGTIVVLVTSPTRSEEILLIKLKNNTASTDKSVKFTRPAPLVTKAQPVELIRNIQPLSEIERPITSAQMLVQLPTPNSSSTEKIVPITGVRANPTDKGVEVILQTSFAQKLQAINRSTGNNFVADIPNAQLQLPSGDAFVFRSEKPIKGITEITVTNFNANIVRITVTGEAGLPKVELFDSNEGLIFGLTPAAEAAHKPTPQPEATPESQKPEPKPGSETLQEKPSVQQEERIELLVTGQQEDDYYVPNARVGTRTNTPQRDIPQSIQVVPRQVIEDQQATSAEEVLRNVPGVAQQYPSRLFPGASFSIRGFTSNNYLRNGLQDTTIASLGFDPALTDRIEVLKGPASVLYGQGSLGGSINFVTKQPLNQPFYLLEGSVGNFNFYRGALDFSGPVNANRTVLYRLNAAAQTSDSFVDFFDSQRYAVAPALTWLISDKTKLSLEFEYLEALQNYDSGLPAQGTVLSNPFGEIKRNRNSGEPSDKNDFRTYRIGYDFEHRFSDNWQMRSAFRVSFLRLDRDYVLSTGLLSDNRTLNRVYSVQDLRDNLYNLDNYIVGKFATGSIQHQLVVGFNLSRLDETNDSVVGQAARLDVFNPVYDQPRGAITSRNDLEFRSDALGIYVQDQITLVQNFKLLLGGRFDIASQKRENLLASTSQFQQDEVFSPRVGIVYQPIQPISLYASYSRSFQPANSAFSNLFPRPERGTQYEVGIKADLSDRLSTTLAFYDLTRSNVLTADPNNPANTIPVGEQNSQGIEFDLSGEILPGWNIIAGYSYTDARVTKDNPSGNNPSNEGNYINNVPKHSFNLWTTYEIQSGNLKGLGFGLGLFYAGERQGDLANSFELPSYLRTDAAIFYKREQFRAALNFRNLFDIEYFESSLSRGRVFYGAPFTVLGTISWQF